ncbi:hypothetical protein Tco_0022067 [Tanacetum coccineum]
MTNKIDTFLKVINDRMTGALPSDTIKNPKPNVNPTSSVSSAHSYLMKDPKSSSNPLKSVNAIKTCFKSTNALLRDQQQIKTLTVNKIETSKSKEPKKSLEDKFKDLHLNLPVLAYALMYNAILDKYVEILELGKNGSAFIQSKMTNKMKVLGLFILPSRLGDSKPFDTLADLGSCVNLIPLRVETRRGFLTTDSAVIDCKKSKIAVGEGITKSMLGVRRLGKARRMYYIGLL